METRTTRLPTDLIDAAEAEGRESHRSAAKQLEHWARFGMFFAGQTDASRRIQRTVAGLVPLTELSADEQVVANATIDANISVPRTASRSLTDSRPAASPPSSSTTKAG